MANAMMTAQLVDAAAVPLGTSGNPLVMSGGVSASNPIDGAVVAGSPFTASAPTANVVTLDLSGVSALDLSVSAIPSGAVVTVSIADASGAYTITPPHFLVSQIVAGSNPAFLGALFAGMYRVPVYGKSARISVSGSFTGNVVFSVVTRGIAVPAAVTYVSGGTVTASSSTPTTDASGTLAAATAAQALAAQPARQLLILTNTGANALVYRFGATAAAASGHTLAAGATVTFDAKVPTGLLSLFSTAGTTWFLTAG